MPLTPEEFAEKIKNIKDNDQNGDWEGIHKKMDIAMEELLNDLGYDKGVKHIQNSIRWYA